MTPRQDLRIAILYELRSGPWGGGNQFLKALRRAFQARGALTDDLDTADAVLINSHHFGADMGLLRRLVQAQARRPELTVIHRVDGPISAVRGRNRPLDHFIFRANRLLADGTVFQSRWSRDETRRLGLLPETPVRVIRNAPDPAVFYRDDQPDRDGRIHLITTSWSANSRKGFEDYRYLDEALDWSRYAMTFVGNAPATFARIRSIPPQDPVQVADLLRAHHIFVAASRSDPCSNALIEALHCGLPAVALRSGGHPEIVGEGGVLYDNRAGLMQAIDRCAAGLETFRRAIRQPSLTEVADAYLDFARHQAGRRRVSAGRRRPGRFAELQVLGALTAAACRIEDRLRRNRAQALL